MDIMGLQNFPLPPTTHVGGGAEVYIRYIIGRIPNPVNPDSIGLCGIFPFFVPALRQHTLLFLLLSEELLA